MAPKRRRADEPGIRHRDDHRRLGWRVLFSRRHRRPAPLPRYAHPIARAHQGGQSRPRPRRARAVAAGGKSERRPQAGLRVVAGAAGKRDRLPTDCRARDRSERPARPLYECARRTLARSRLVGARRSQQRTMTFALALHIVLAVVVLGLAVWTIVARDTFAAVVGFVVYGLFLALVWVRLGAVDVALAEAAIGGGLNGVLLLGAAARLRTAETSAETERPGRMLRAAAAVFSASVAGALALGALLLPDPAPTLAPDAAANASATG